MPRGQTTQATQVRTRRRVGASGDVVSELAATVDALIEENRKLKLALRRHEQNGGAGGVTARALEGLQRRVSRALVPAATGGGGRRRATVESAPPAPRPRRTVTNPDVLERRRQSLAKARAARAAKRQALMEMPDAPVEATG